MGICFLSLKTDRSPSNGAPPVLVAVSELVRRIKPQVWWHCKTSSHRPVLYCTVLAPPVPPRLLPCTTGFQDSTHPRLPRGPCPRMPNRVLGGFNSTLFVRIFLIDICEGTQFEWVTRAFCQMSLLNLPGTKRLVLMHDLQPNPLTKCWLFWNNIKCCLITHLKRASPIIAWLLSGPTSISYASIFMQLDKHQAS